MDRLDGVYFGNTFPTLTKEVLEGGSPDMTGVYRIRNAQFSDGIRYTGTVSSTLKSGIYQISYSLTSQGTTDNFMGYGLREGPLLGVATHSGGPFGFAKYKIQNDGGVLAGENGSSAASTSGTGTETLTRSK